jgi:hypothetical protein
MIGDDDEDDNDDFGDDCDFRSSRALAVNPAADRAVVDADRGRDDANVEGSRATKSLTY